MIAAAICDQAEQRKLYTHALRFTRNPEDAEDLVQEVIIRALSSRSTFKEEGNVSAWLYGILKNVFTDTCRKAKRSPQTSYDGDVTDWDMNSVATHTSVGLPSAEAIAMDQITDPSLVEAMAALPTEFAQVVYLSDVEGHPQHTIAETLEIPVGTVKSRLSRGRNLLRESITANRKAHA